MAFRAASLPLIWMVVTVEAFLNKEQKYLMITRSRLRKAVKVCLH